MKVGFNWVGALRVGLVVSFVLAFCISTGHQAWALPLASGAMFTGMAEAGEASGHRWRTMIWATFWLCIASLIAGLLADQLWLGLIATAVFSAFTGISGAAGPRAGLIGLLGLVIFTIYLGAPDSSTTPLQSSLLIACGGALQALVMIVPNLIRNPKLFIQKYERMPSFWNRIRPHLVWGDTYVDHAVRLTIAVTTATVIANMSGLSHQYWLPMTAAWVTQAGRLGTIKRVISRVLGTIVGLIFVFIAIEMLHAHDWWLALFCGIGGAAAVGFITANYIYAVTGVTSLIVTLLWLDGDPLTNTAPQRIGETIVAGIIAIITLSIWPDKNQEPGEQPTTSLAK